MSKSAFQPVVLTANRLDDGIVVFLDFEGAWGLSLAEAVVAHSPDEVAALQDRATHDAARNLVVEPYLVEVNDAGGLPKPIRYREIVRAAGPSMLGDVPGYVSPALASPTPRLRGEGRGEGQMLAPELVDALEQAA